MRFSREREYALGEAIKAKHLHAEQAAQRFRKQALRLIGVLLRHEQNRALTVLLMRAQGGDHAGGLARIRAA